MRLAARLERLERRPPRQTEARATPALPVPLVYAVEHFCCSRWYGPLGFDAFDLRDPATAARLDAACGELARLPDTTTEADYLRALSDLLGDA